MDTKIMDIKNFDGSRRAEVWLDDKSWRIMFFEGEKLVHSCNINDGLRKAELLAEDFAYGNSSPGLLLEG